MGVSDNRNVQTGNYSDLSYNNKKSKALKPVHKVGIAAVGIVAVVIVVRVLLSVAGVIFHVIEIAAVVALIYAVIRLFMKHKTEN